MTRECDEDGRSYSYICISCGGYFTSSNPDRLTCLYCGGNQIQDSEDVR